MQLGNTLAMGERAARQDLHLNASAQQGWSSDALNSGQLRQQRRQMPRLWAKICKFPAFLFGSLENP